MKDIHNNLSIVPALTPRTISSNTTSVGSIIDLAGFSSVEFAISSGTLTDGAYAVLIEDGDAANLSDAAAVADDYLLGTELAAGFAATDDNLVKKIGYKGSKRYVRLSLVSTSVTTGGLLSAVAIRGDANLVPTV